MALPDIFDTENHSLTEDALKEALFSVKPFAHKLTDTDIVQIATLRKRSPEEIVDIVQDARNAEMLLIDAALTQCEPEFRNLEFRRKENTSGVLGLKYYPGVIKHYSPSDTAEVVFESVKGALKKGYARLLTGQEEKSADQLIDEILLRAYRWADMKKVQGRQSEPDR